MVYYLFSEFFCFLWQKDNTLTKLQHFINTLLFLDRLLTFLSLISIPSNFLFILNKHFTDPNFITIYISLPHTWYSIPSEQLQVSDHCSQEIIYDSIRSKQQNNINIILSSLFPPSSHLLRK